MPLAVRYARLLLGIQGCIWAELAVLAAIVAGYAAWQILVANENAVVGFGAALLICGLAVAFAVVKVYLARSLARGEDRTVVIGVEAAMTATGVIMAAGTRFSGGLPAVLFGLAAIAGAGLSLAAVVGLLRGQGRQYFASPGSVRGFIGTDGRPPAGPGSESYWTWGARIKPSLKPGIC